MTSVTPFSDDDAKQMWRILSRWLKVPRPTSNAKNRLATSWVKNHYANTMNPDTLVFSMPKAPLPLASRTFGWIVGSPLKRAEHVVPVLTVSIGKKIDNEIQGVALRVSLIHEREDGTLYAEGWRFEQGEVDEEDDQESSAEEPRSGPAHPYSHAQAIIGWIKGSDCLLHPPHAREDTCSGIDPCNEPKLDHERKEHQMLTLVRHPAFPLGVSTMTGLALAVISTLYGNAGAQNVVRGESTLRYARGAIADDLKLLSLDV